MPGSRVDHARKVRDCIAKHQAAATPLDGPAPLILDSWRRCAHEHALDPEAPAVEVVLDGPALCRRRERLGELYCTARTEMEKLYQQTAGSGCAVLLADANGGIIECIADQPFEVKFASLGLRLGADRSERYAGTNGTGTCIAERLPLTIYRDEHFLSCNTALSTSAAPIHDSHGRLLAVLSASSMRSGETRQSQRHASALVFMAARLIENCSFLSLYRRAWVLRFHVRPELVGLLGEGMLAIDADGVVLAANLSAIKQLGRTSHGDLVGQPIDELLDLPASLIGGDADGGEVSVWPMRCLRHGNHYFAFLRGPLSGTRATSTRPSSRKRMVRALVSDHPSEASSLSALAAGGDPRMAYNVRCARRLMDRNVAILLCGETGTGKEVLARAIHAGSRRAWEPFVAVNCASIPESLIESELFGYRSGAFTGARRDGMRGKIAQSSGGTLFLDEIGDMPPPLQTRLLRVFEQREILPLGSETPIPVDPHVICATHRDLPAMVEQGLFREDLYYRLNGVMLILPPLRERRDREVIIRRVLGEECDAEEAVAIEEDAFKRLIAYPWPGNIRQLRNRIRTMLALCDDNIVRLADIPPELLSDPIPGQSNIDGAAVSGTAGAAQAGAVDDASPNPLVCAERDILLHELERHRWNVTNTASALGFSRNTMYRKMKKHGISVSQTSS